MSKVLTTYSGKDVNFSLISPLIGAPIQGGGVAETGIAKITTRMLTVQSTTKTAMDGSVVPSALPGDQGEIEIEVWQTSTIHQDFLALYNAMKAARDGAGDVSNWFGATMVITSILDGSSHIGTGVAPQKVPDKSYGEEAATITWIFACCNLINE